MPNKRLFSANYHLTADTQGEDTAVNNAEPKSPLTIIAILAGIIEASALASLPFLSEGSQNTYTWFLVGFPFFLTVLFFLTLNFNYRSLYSPPDTIDSAAPSMSSAHTPIATDTTVLELTQSAEHADRYSETINLPTGRLKASTHAPESPLQTTQTLVAITISGANSNQLLEHFATQALSQNQPLHTTWVLYNPQAGTRTTLETRPLET